MDILTLDDPLIAYERDINFMPIAYDYLVLVSGPQSRKIESISDLEGLDFVNVNGSAQRLAWNSLNHYDIEYNLKKNVNSQFDAFKIVRNSENLLFIDMSCSRIFSSILFILFGIFLI